MCIPRFVRLVLLFALLVAGLSACGGEPVPRTLDEIFAEEQNLPVLYLTAVTNTRVTAPARFQRFSDPATKEVCWPALACYNPDCPGKSHTGEPFIFISPDIGFVARDDGTAVLGTPVAGTTKGTSNLCPQCLKARNRNTENAATRQKYVDWVRPYVLPETEEKRKALVEERRKRYEWEKTKAQ